MSLPLALLSAALAADGRLAIELIGDAPPDYLCTLSAAQGASVPASLLREWSPELRGAGPEVIPRELTLDLSPGDWNDLLQESKEAGDTAQARVVEAMRRMSVAPPEPADETPRCEDAAPSLCEPAVELPVEWLAWPAAALSVDDLMSYHLSCQVNTLANEPGVAREPRVLLLLVDGRNPRDYAPAIREIRLYGSLVELSYAAPPGGDFPFLGVGVIGGHYQPGPAQLTSEGQLQLAPEPRCERREFQLPASALGLPDPAGASGARPVEFLTLIGGEGACPAEPGGEICAAQVDAYGRFELYGPLGGAERRVAVCAQHGAPAEPVARMEARLRPQAGADLVRLSPVQVTFWWERHPLYPVAQEGELAERYPSCPQARLAEPGIECGEGVLVDHPRPACRYTCPAELGDGASTLIGFPLPVTVRFQRGGSDDVWEEQLGYIGERIDGYVAPDRRQIPVDFTRWFPPDEGRLVHERSGDEIERVEILTPAGGLRIAYPSPGDEERVPLPGALPGDVYRYQIRGARAYAEGEVRLEQGHLSMPHPRELARTVSLSVAAGGGMMGSVYLIDGDGIPYNEWSDWVAAPAPVLGLEAALVHRPFGVREQRGIAHSVWFELRGRVELGWRDYGPIDVTGDVVDFEDYVNVLNSWLIFEPMVILGPWPRVSIGAGLGPAVSTPLRGEDFDRVGYPWPALHGSLQPRLRFQEGVTGALHFGASGSRLRDHTVYGGSEGARLFLGDVRYIEHRGVDLSAQLMLRFERWPN